MRRSALGVLCAVLLWCASCWGAANAASPAEGSAPARPEPLSLGGSVPWAPLNGKSVYWFDSTGSASVDTVEASASNLPWHLRKREPHDRVLGGAYWFQFEATARPGEHWYLEINTAFYDHVEMFYRDRLGNWVVQQSGTMHAVSDWSVPGRLPTFALAFDDARPVRYWVRVQDDRADLSAPATLLREEALQQSREREQFLFGAYFGLAALVTLAALGNGLLYRDRGFLAFGLYSLLLGAGQLGRSGVLAQHLWPELPGWNGIALALWPGAATAAALWFVKVVTEPVRLSRALDLGVWALIAALLGSVAVDLAIVTRVSMVLVLVLTGLSLLAIAAMLVWGLLDNRDLHMRLLVVGFVPVLLMAIFPLSRGLGLVPSSTLTRYGLYFAAILELPILFYALHLRLMAKREATLRASALSRTDALTGLPHRLGLVQRLESSLAHARGQKQNCALLGVRISNLDAITQEFGKDAADKALVIAASHLKRTSVDFDMAARVGDREYAVLMEAPVTPQAVSSRAQQVVASGLRQMEALPAALTLKFHVTAAVLPVSQLDGEGTLQWVLDGLDQMTQDAKKLIKPLNF
jgi:two-component system, sensor histidine kinase LadS